MITDNAPSTDSNQPTVLACARFHGQHPKLAWSGTGTVDPGTTGRVRFSAVTKDAIPAAAIHSGWHELSGDSPVNIEKSLDLSGAPFGTAWTVCVVGQKLSGDGSIRCRTNVLRGFTP